MFKFDIKNKNNIIYYVILLIIFFAVGFKFGVIPGFTYPSTGIGFSLIGTSLSLFEHGNGLNYLDNVLYPYGGYLSEGFGQAILAGILVVLGFKGETAVILTYFIIYI